MIIKNLNSYKSSLSERAIYLDELILIILSFKF
jgi:hypothetical protein